ncbi:MAG: multicopper oxidase domain-containing protein [Polyangiaceae bacterium]|nr:multicopper oxidase domain-containing protein [Polyangiaceae bacterium]
MFDTIRYFRIGALGALGTVTFVLMGCGDDTETEDPTPVPVDPSPLDPKSIEKFADPLVIPGVMPPIETGAERTDYRIAVRQFRQQVLPKSMPMTTVWGYGRQGDPLPDADPASTFHYPAFTIEARSNNPVRVTWVNELVKADGTFLPHLLPVDSTIHWADPGGQGHDHSGQSALYTGPVPTVTHVHGAHSFAHSDGHPEAWFLPNATNIPDGFSMRGPTYASQEDVGPGEAVFDYPMDEDAATLWYHDHSLGMTRLNVAAGLAGFWIIRDEAEEALGLPGPAPSVGDAPGTRYYEIPLVLQDRTFLDDGSLSYPDSRAEYDGYEGPFIPDSQVPPIWGPEFFGNVIVVNGRTWPYLEVEPRLYRFRLLNGADARTFILQPDNDDVEFQIIGSDGGLLAGAPVVEKQLLIGPAERVDMLVDFSGLAVGETVTLLNSGPDEAWGGPDVDPPQDPADPDTTGQVMQFRIVEPTGSGEAGAVPADLRTIEPLTPTAPHRDLLLQELAVDDGQYPYHVQLGTVAEGTLPWAAPATEIIKVDDTEIWRVANTTEDAHPIHLHLIDFQILDRTPFDVEGFKAAEQAWLDGTGPQPLLDDFMTGPPTGPALAEAGEKDTVMMIPGTITRIIARFDRVGSYVWHCHIIEHEDNDMMRPLEIVE